MRRSGEAQKCEALRKNREVWNGTETRRKDTEL